VNEFFAEATLGELGLPKQELNRFKGRSQKVGQVRPIYGPPLSSFEMNVVQGTLSEYTVHIYTTDSKGSGTTKKTLTDIQKNGAWLAYHDVVPKGGPIGPTVATFFGYPVSSLLFRLLYNSIKDIYIFLKPWTISAHPFVVYHGTSRSNVKSILDNGLRPTQGMLGLAIYFGSFWKAFRFASLSQEYKKRPGAILRCYAFWNTPYFIRPGSMCSCVDCLKTIPVSGADHDGLWTSFADCVFLYPWPGGPIKNEEYACKDSKKIMIDSIGHCISQSEHHEPLDRNLTIE
jgi:hypothetical protein